MKTSTYAPLLLRAGLAFLFLWFGYQQLVDASSWIDWVPQWALTISGLSADTIVFFNGLLEVIGGLMIAAGFYIRPIALVLSLHLAVIAIDIGIFTGIGVRDAALAAATLALALSEEHVWTINGKVV